MIDNATFNRMKILFEDEGFISKFSEIEDYSELKKLFIDNGVEISDEDLIKILESTLISIENKNSAELSEEQMDDVSGGFVEWIVLGGFAAAVGGVATYKLRKLINTGTGVCK